MTAESAVHLAMPAVPGVLAFFAAGNILGRSHV